MNRWWFRAAGAGRQRSPVALIMPWLLALYAAASLLHFTLTPEEMQSPSVDRAFFIGAGIGYIRVTSFDEKTAQEIKAAVEKLGGDRLAGLVIDLRNNPGGVLTAAVETASLSAAARRRAYWVARSVFLADWIRSVSPWSRCSLRIQVWWHRRPAGPKQAAQDRRDACPTVTLLR